MSRLMQLPSLYGVRGAIATQTMSKLTDEQIQEIGEIVERVIDDPALAADKYEFTKQLGNTIQGDYRSNKETAQHEFCIAVWRATVYLLHHRDYAYYCTLCGETEYITSTDKRKAFDRQYPICPSCSKTLLEGQVVVLQRESRGYHLTTEDNEKIGERYNKRVDVERKVETPIKTILGSKKVPDPRKILDDDEQRGKWYSVWAWNYFRQILNENTRRAHNKRQTIISGPANTMAVHELISEFKRSGYKYFIDESTINDNEVEILASTIATNHAWTAFFIALVNKYKNYEVEIDHNFYSIKIKTVKEAPVIEATITTEDQVIMLSLNTPNKNGNDETDNWSDILESNSVSDKIEADADLDEVDWMKAVRSSLPDEICRGIFDIYVQKGDNWTEFSDEYGTRVAAKSHLSKFLEIPIKQVDAYRQIMMHACQGYGIGLDLAYQDDELMSLEIEEGELMVITTIDGETLAHIDTECPYIQKHMGVFDAKDDRWCAGQVAHTTHKFVKLKGHEQLIEVCHHCVNNDN
jgi:hypothetical protein